MLGKHRAVPCLAPSSPRLLHSTGRLLFLHLALPLVRTLLLGFTLLVEDDVKHLHKLGVLLCHAASDGKEIPLHLGATVKESDSWVRVFYLLPASILFSILAELYFAASRFSASLRCS